MWRGELIESAFGNLTIFEHPEKGAQYTVGVDTSSGLRASKDNGDPSAAEVLEMRTCRQVAEMHGFMEPVQWGYAVSRLAGFYNLAPLAIETHPSQHGLAAFVAAERYGYPKLYMQRKLDSRLGIMTERRGWVRNPASTFALHDRIREALKDGVLIRSARLLDELGAIRYEEAKFRSDGHDDCIIAYGIALHLRDQAFRLGLVKPEEKGPMDVADHYWEGQAKALARSTPGATTSEKELDDVWNGV